MTNPAQLPVPWLTGTPGVEIVAPSTPADAKGLLRAAIDADITRALG